ncbi:MAG TPA: hypothetical protein VIB07_07290 [Nitrososphaera sp.]|jgi:hypothetical protein
MATTRSMSKRKQLIALVGVAILAASVGASSILGMSARNITTPTLGYVETVVDELITVEAGTYEYREFTVPAEANGNSRILGEFTSSGSSFESDVVVTIAPEKSLVSLEEGKGFEAYYFSGKVPKGEINAKVPEGKHYLIFDNRFGTSDKGVDAKFELTY